MTKPTFWKYAIKCRASLVSYVKKKGIDDAEDVVDDLFISLVANKSYKRVGKVRNYPAWFHTATWKAIANSRRKETRLREKQTRLHADMAYDIELDLESRIESQKVFDSLSLDNQFLVYWHFIVGYTVSEIARRYDMTEEAIKMKIHRIRASLRRI